LDAHVLLLITELCFVLFRFVEKGNLEILLFSIQSQMRANNQKPYTPSEGRLISDLNRAWDQLEKAEHERELALRDELIRYVSSFPSV
jgi:spectrin beta